MADVTVEAATRVYECGAAAEVERRRVWHPEFRDFSFRVRRLLRALGEAAEDEYWKPLVRTLKRYRFEASVAPVGFGSRYLMPPETIARMEAHLSRCRLLFPEFEQEAAAAVGVLWGLVAADENPLLDELAELSAPGWSLTVVLKETRHVPILDEVLAARGLAESISVVSEAQLRGGRCYERIACVGAGGWYDEYVFRAPRAPHVLVVSFGWIQDARARGSLFEGWERVRTALNIQRRAEEADEPAPHGPAPQEGVLEVEELAPRLDLAQLTRRYAAAEGAREDEAEDVSARLFQLEGKRGVFLEAEERGTALVIDLEEDHRRRVKRVGTAHITPGMFLLLREGGGGGDYLVPIADKILRDRAAGLRKFQRRWKDSLRSAVRTFGLPAVVGKLRALGSVKANEVNVRNWMSERNIRTDDPRDFKAIMGLVGLSADSDRCWEFAREIASAHQRAGGVVRRHLLRKVLESDLGDLEKVGSMRFELSEVGGNPLSAVRVVRVLPEVVRVSAAHLGKLIDLEDGEWRA